MEGTVTLNGDPVKKGAISFRPVDGRGNSVGGMIVEGQYNIPQAVPGPRIAVITAIDEGNVMFSRDEATKQTQTVNPEGRNAFGAARVDLIPRNAKGNNQQVEIKAGAQTLDFAVTTE